MKKLFWFAALIFFLILANIYLLVKIKKVKENRALKSKAAVSQKANHQDSQPVLNQEGKNQKIVIAAVGDLGLGREVNWQIKTRQDPNFPFLKTAEILKEANLAVANLESPLIKNCLPTRTGMKFCASPELVEGLVFAGIDLVNLANNHTDDYGQEGFEQTLEALNDYRIGYFGSGTIGRRDIDGRRIAFLGFDDTVQPTEEEEVAGQTEKSKKESDLVIVSFHWGVEYQKTPSQRQKELAHLAIDHGADLVIGHHPHVLQPIEYYQGKLILYSLGNFVFDQMWSRETRIGAIALITFEKGEQAKLELLPTLIKDCCQPELITEPEKSAIIKQINI
ncbi:MAG: CapA family protein [Patescibacteria group bacterium]|nr:CapA family protein [Patescibacteria group bacterium]